MLFELIFDFCAEVGTAGYAIDSFTDNRYEPPVRLRRLCQ